MAWELKKVEDQRQLLIEAYLKNNYTMVELCKHFGVSRKTAYKWLHRYQCSGLEGLKDRSKAPLHPYTCYRDEAIQMAIELKCRYTKWGSRKILARLKRDFPNQQWPSETRLYEIFKENNLVLPKRIKRRVPATHPLGHVNQSNDVWSADFKGWTLAKNGQKWEPLTLTDNFSRYLLKCEHLEGKSSNYVWAIFEEAFREYGLPLRVRTDNGPPFGSVGVGRLTPLSVRLIKTGVTPEWINPGHPEENGRHERFHLTLEREVVMPKAENIQELKVRATRFQDEYNFDRPHESLNMRTPGEFYSKSLRTWDGKLRPPEYDESQMEVRKVGQNGCVWIRQSEYYIGTSLVGEYIGLKHIEEGLELYYGPVYLGKITKHNTFEVPKQTPKKIVRRR